MYVDFWLRKITEYHPHHTPYRLCFRTEPIGGARVVGLPSCHLGPNKGKKEREGKGGGCWGPNQQETKIWSNRPTAIGFTRDPSISYIGFTRSPPIPKATHGRFSRGDRVSLHVHMILCLWAYTILELVLTEVGGAREVGFSTLVGPTI